MVQNTILELARAIWNQMFVYVAGMIRRFVYDAGMIRRFVYVAGMIRQFVYVAGMIRQFVYVAGMNTDIQKAVAAYSLYSCLENPVSWSQKLHTDSHGF